MIGIEQLKHNTNDVAAKDGESVEEWLEHNKDVINVDEFTEWGAWLLEFFSDDVWTAAVLLAGVQMGFDLARAEFDPQRSQLTS